MAQESLATAAQSANALDDVRTWQQFQTIYHKITGKKEQLKRTYSEPYQITFKDLEDLHQRIKQAAEPYPVSAQNESVTLVYDDNSNPVHSSFDRFKTQADVGNTALKSVTIEYNIAIETTQSNDVNSYKITVDVISGVAVFSEIQKEIPKLFWQGIGYRTGRATIEYVDYPIAQNFMGVINSWFAGRAQAPKRKVFDWIQSHSNFVPRITKAAFLIISAMVLINSIGKQLPLSNNQEMARFIILGGTFIVLFTETGWLIGKAIERSIDQIWKLAYIDLNEGDRKLICKVRDHNNGCVLSIVYRVIAFLFLAALSVLVKEVLSRWI